MNFLHVIENKFLHLEILVKVFVIARVQYFILQVLSFAGSLPHYTLHAHATHTLPEEI